MSDLLQKHLQSEAAKQNNLKLLESQWNFDKQLIPKVLQQIAQLFPHYSRHDQSHSEQILVNIERLLGASRIEMLSATDVWLLLEAAYWHDIGMVVPHKDLKEALTSSEFKIYRDSIADDLSHELHNFAKYFKGEDVTQAFFGADNPLDAIGKFRLLMADWFRRQHPTRSERSVNDPWTELGLNSPRTELIPKRLFRILGRICAMHGASFEEVLTQLPHKEVGMSNDDCHPRFIACLLRLGDLLDMDDNRFCPVMQRIAGERPALSRAHEDKHSSIRHFRLDSNRIEISAICDSVDGYVEQWSWLDYLRGEMQCQMGRWQDIAPSAALGLLPTLGKIQVDISGRQLIAQAGKRPEFTLNSDRVMTLLRGENLYRRDDSIRELLQNAVDATLLRVWIESKAEGKPITGFPDSSAENYFKRYPISVKIEKKDLPYLGRKDYVRWELSIQDKGVGISQNDLKHIMNIGSSFKNSKKNADINDMPEWFKPSGTFGIGLQSVFMWTDEVRIATKNIHTQELLNISLHSPLGPKRGLVTVELAEGKYSCDVGTKISFAWDTERVPRNFSISSKQEITSVAYRTFDALLDDDLPIDALSVCDAVKKFSDASLINISCELRSDKEKYIVFCNKNEMSEFNSDYFNETNSRFHVSLDERSSNVLLYRGQNVEDAKIPSHYLLKYTLDLYSGKASEYLTFSRNSTTTEGRLEIEKIVRRNIALWAKRNSNDEKSKNVISLLAKHWVTFDDVDFPENNQIWKDISLKLNSQWKLLPCKILDGKIEEKYISFADAMSEGNYIYAGYDDKKMKFRTGSSHKVILGQYAHLDLYRHLAQDWCRETSNGVRYLIGTVEKQLSSKGKRSLMQFVKVTRGQPQVLVDADALIFRIEEAISNVSRSIRILLPIFVFPDELELNALAMSKNTLLSGYRYVFPHLPDIPTSYVLLPFEIKPNERYLTKVGLERFDEFTQFIHSKLENPTTIEKLREFYNRLIDYVDNELMKNSDVWKDARKN